MRFITVLLCFMLIAAPAQARFQPQPCKNSYSTNQEITEGKKAAAQIYKQMPVLPDSSPVTKYIQQLGDKLVKYAPGYRWPYQFHVVNMADVNAFALPGGAIFVNLGTIQAAENEAQLAGVIAHEISHVVLRHATCNLTKQRTPGMLAGIGQIAAGVLLGGGAGALAAQGIGAVAGLGFLKMSRGSEKEADLLGTDILHDSGYDPRGMAQFFEIMQARYGEGSAQWLSDHPNPGNRGAYVNDEIATLPRKAHYIETSPEFSRIKKLVSGMHAYTAREVAAGAWKSQTANQTVAQSVHSPAIDPAPSSNWQSIEGPGFHVEYPGNWRAYSGSGRAITIAPEGGVQDQGSGSTIVYGVLIGAYSSRQGNNLIANSEQLLSKLMQTNPGLTCGKASNLEAGGRAARSVECTSAAERDWIVSVGRPNGDLQYIVFIARPTTSKSCAPLTAECSTAFACARDGESSTLCSDEQSLINREMEPHGLKPSLFTAFTARLKSCTDTKHQGGSSRSLFQPSLRSLSYPSFKQDLLVEGQKQSWGLRPSFSAHVRWGEHGAPVRYPPAFATTQTPTGLQWWVQTQDSVLARSAVPADSISSEAFSRRF